jgi:N-acetylneuraminate synthase/N,N'-diacetyllegionaminate synthase
MRSFRDAVGDPDAVYVVAEAGVNHNGDVEVAERLVDAAAESGADAVKFQTFAADRLVTEEAPKAEYQDETTDDRSQREMLENYELSRADHERLQSYCDERGVTFLSTPFDAESADLLADLGVPVVKIGSGELDNLPLLEHVAAVGRPMIVSTGMGTMAEVREAFETICGANPDVDLVFLHCTSAYPTEMADANLRAMETMAEELPVPVGYSDHTTAPETPGLAVAAGATVVEKHFTLSKRLPGPDHRASLEPDELDRAVSLAREAAVARGDPEKRPTSEERENRSVIRKSVHATERVPAGETLTAERVAVTRPADGLPPKTYETLVGATVSETLARGEAVTKNVVDAEIDASEEEFDSQSRRSR